MSEHEQPEPRTERDRDLASYLAVDLPSPRSFARLLAATAPELAATLLLAKRNANGWRVKLPADDPRLKALRSLGLVEVLGFEPTENQLRAGRGTYLGDFGERVRDWLAQTHIEAREP